MNKLRKHIKESFFNPVLHLLPLLVFMVVDDYWGMFIAWEVCYPVAFLLLVYIYFSVGTVFTWHLIFTLFFVSTSLIAATESLLENPPIPQEIIYEGVVLVVFIVSLLFRKKIQQIVTSFMPQLLPMTNNFEELIRVIRLFSAVLFLYISGYYLLILLQIQQLPYYQFLQNFYVGLLLFLCVYELLRVKIIRSNLVREKWLPIVNNQGKVIGSIQHQTSLNDEKKYQHPVIRILMVDKGMILLNNEQKESTSEWDSTLSEHVIMEESIENCVERTVKEKFEIDNFKYMHLSTYSIDCEKEIQHAFLFISCLQSDSKIDAPISEKTKWWTKNQIEANLQLGIFSKNFEMEYDLLLRSGLLDTGVCNCNCRLKEVIYNQPFAPKVLD